MTARLTATSETSWTETISTPSLWPLRITGTFPFPSRPISAGKAVYVEKPLSLTIQEGRLLADEVQRYGGIVQVGSQQRSAEYEKFARAVELVRNGRVGEIQKIEVRNSSSQRQ